MHSNVAVTLIPFQYRSLDRVSVGTLHDDICSYLSSVVEPTASDASVSRQANSHSWKYCISCPNPVSQCTVSPHKMFPQTLFASEQNPLAHIILGDIIHWGTLFTHADTSIDWLNEIMQLPYICIQFEPVEVARPFLL